jgi:hypothetical protein
MELSNDQKAILRLLAQRGAAGYDDLTALMGISAAEVHERAKAAAAELEADGIPAPTIPLPGEAEPESPAGPVVPAQSPKSEPAVPPEVEAPAVSAAAGAPTSASPEPPRKDPPKSPASRPKLALPKSNGARAAIAAGVAVAVALIIVLAVSGGGGGSGDTTTSASSEGAGAGAEETVSASSNPKLTQAVLSPVDGGDAKGVATFGRVKNSLALQVEAEGLAPTTKGQSYTIWLYESPQKMLPLASTAVPASGKIGAQVEVPTEVLAYLANETFDQVDISLTDEATLKASLAKATKEKKAPLYTGTDVLRGTISGPIVGGAKKKK